MSDPITTEFISNDIAPPPDVNLMIVSKPPPVSEELQVVPSRVLSNFHITTTYRFDSIKLLEKYISH